MLRTPDGAEHELRPTGNPEMYHGVDHPRPYLWGHFKDTPYSTNAPMQYYSTDGTYISAIVNPAGHASGIRWTMFLPDGTQVIDYENGPEPFQRIRDNNGNSIKIFEAGGVTHYVDEQSGREIKITGSIGSGQIQVWYKTVTGLDQHIDINFGQTIVKGKIYRVNDWNAGWHTETEEGAECTRYEKLPPTALEVVREIVFPVTEANQPARRFTFAYNSDTTESFTTQAAFFTCGAPLEPYFREASRGMGALSRIETPTGAVVDYTYSLASTHDFTGFAVKDQLVKESVVTKSLTHDGAIDTWTYTIPNQSNSISSSVTNPDGTIVTQNYYAMDPGFAQTIGYDDPRAGLVYHTSNGLTETYRHWTNRGVQIASGSQNSSAINSFVDAEYTSYVGTNLMSAKTYQYDLNGNLTQVKEYDWFDSTAIGRDNTGVPLSIPAAATLLRTTNTSYHNSAPEVTSANYYMTRALVSGVPSILNAPKEVTVGPSITHFSYDGQTYGVVPTLGNLTSQSVWDDLDNKWITSSQTYGLYGNLATKTDPRDKTTQFFYEDNTHARPTRVVVDPENGTGAQTTFTAYDFATGQVISQTDPNGKTSEISYTNQLLGAIDPFGRPGLALGPAISIGGVSQRHRTTTTYIDHLRQVVTASDLNNANDQLLKARTTVDMLGRVILSEQSEDGTNYTISARKVYEQMGRITFSSNPSRSSAASTDGWTRATADAFGRVIEVATFGGAAQPPTTGTNSSWTGSVITAYDANFTTVTDQAGRQRRSKVDALGRLLRVDEPGDPNVNGSLGSNAGPTQPTSYEYDVFGNLRKVYQGSQLREFTYDSLSRLRIASNPENGIITYTYDDNGNLLTRTDARAVTINYGYDALNRNTTVDYSNTTIVPDITRMYDGATNGKGRLWQSYAGGTEAAGSVVDHQKIASYDELGRPLVLEQRFKLNSAWSPNIYQTTRGYSLAGNVTSQTYPSGHTVAYAYDAAGRTNSFSGNLGDGAPRSYTGEIAYSSLGAMAKEKFGTDTAVYNKLYHNSRGQLVELRQTTTDAGPTDTSWNRGKSVNWYNLQCGGPNCNAPENNGNLRKQETFIPTNEQNTSSVSWYQQYEYDSLNRLTEVHEHASNNSLLWHQSYAYDRFGNRTINASGTSSGINSQAFEVENTTNRLLATGDSVLTGSNLPQRKMRYDAAGNLTNDNWSSYGSSTPGQITRTYDAENRMTSAWDSSGGISYYTYNADGQRVRRKIGNVETWQVYGFDGELLAEYAADTPHTSPQKEYGYRNGQLLITASGAVSAKLSIASATASSSYSSSYTPEKAIDGNQNTWWSSGGFPTQWIQLDLGAAASLNKVRLLVNQDPSGTTTHEVYGGPTSGSLGLLGTLSGSTQEWQWLELASTATNVRYIKVVTTSSPSWVGWREIEVYGGEAVVSTPLTVASSGFETPSLGGPFYQYGPSGGSWTFAGQSGVSGNNSDFTAWNPAAPQGSQVAFLQGGGWSVISQSVAGFQSSTDYTVSFKTAQRGIYQPGPQSFDVYLDTTLLGTFQPSGTSYTEITTLSFQTSSGSHILKFVGKDMTGGNTAFIDDVRVTRTGGQSSGAKIDWLVVDHLGTLRMIIDKTGSLAGIKRHDFLPFGEELIATQGARTAAMGYSADDTRQKFTSKERDAETGLDYFLARYYSAGQGRFTSPDPILISDQQSSNPQLWNLYNYATNNPLAVTDPTGMRIVRLGQHSDEQITSRRDEILAQLHNPNSKLTAAEQETLVNEFTDLGLEMQGNAIVNRELEHLRSIGKDQGLKLSDFTLMTDPKKDILSDKEYVAKVGLKVAQGVAEEAENGSMFVLYRFQNQIYINGSGDTYLGAAGIRTESTQEDYQLYGASEMRHEKVHRDNRNKSEHAAYREQLKILRQFGPGAFKSQEFYQRRIDFVKGKLGKKT